MHRSAPPSAAPRQLHLRGPGFPYFAHEFDSLVGVLVRQWKPIFRSRQLRERFGRFRLIPVGDARIVVFKVVGVPVFDAAAQTRRKIDRILEVKAVAVGAAEPTDVVVHARVAEIRMRIPFFGAPA